MGWQFWKSDGTWKVSTQYTALLGRKFALKATDIDKLLCFERKSKIDGSSVLMLRAYDASRVTVDFGTSVSDEQLSEFADALMFEGHIDSNGALSMSDLRPAAV